MEELFIQAAQVLAQRGNAIAVTGAGVSVDSGIPDFRSASGIWSRYDPQEYATLDAFEADPDRVWEMWYDLGESLSGAKPNAGHYALAELERLGLLRTIITQNIDNLHTEAGSVSVVEYHGNGHWVRCPACADVHPFSLDQRMGGAPRCACGSAMKPDVVLFGEIIPPSALARANAAAMSCDTVIIVGTSATVYPAAQIPFTAKEHGACIIECNIERTEFTDSITDFFLQGPAAQTLPELVRRIGEVEL